MKLRNFLGLVIACLLAVVALYATSNIIIGGGTLLASLAFYYLYVYKKLECHANLIKKLHECYLFINNFLITLSIKESVNAAFEAVEGTISDEFKDYLESIKDMTSEEKLIYLKKYFPFHIYAIFVDVVMMWLEEGGNILKMSEQVTNELRELEEYVTYSESISKRKGVEISTLWLFSLAIVIILRISLKDFYQRLAKQLVYIGAIALLMGMVLLTIFIFINKWMKLDIKGVEVDEQLKKDD